MGTIDTAILIVFGVFLFLGIYKGFVKSVFSIAAWVIAFIVPFFLSKPATLLIAKFDSSGKFATGSIVFVGLFILTFIIVKIIGHNLSKSVKKGALGLVDRLLGGIWGAARALLIISLVLLLLKGIANLPLVGEGVLKFLTNDLKLNSNANSIGKYLYLNNLLPKFIDFIF